MRKLRLAAAFLAAFLLAPIAALAQGIGYGSPGTFNQGSPGSSPWLMNLYINGALNSVANPGFLQLTPGTAYGGQFGVSATAITGGIASFSRLPTSAASTNLTQAKSGAGRLYKVVACNTTTSIFRIKFYNALSANVTVGTTAPVFSRPFPAAAATGGAACSSWDWADIGVSPFTVGISWAITSGAADNDATAVTAGAATDVSVEFQ